MIANLWDKLNIDQARIEREIAQRKANAASVSASKGAATSSSAADPSPLPDIDSSTNLEQDDDSTSRNFIEILETDVKTNVPSKNLIWASYYRYGAFFPARLCENEEALTEKSIKWPIPNHEAVVEIFCQDKYKGMTKVLLIEKSKIHPYYTANTNDTTPTPSADGARWNENRLKQLKKALQEKLKKKAFAETMYSAIITTANNYLGASLLYDEILEKETTPIKAKSGSFLHRNSDDEDVRYTPNVGNRRESILQTVALQQGNKKLSLHIGDRIRYRNRLHGGEMESVVSEFLDNHKITVENGEVLKGDDLICLMIPTSSNETTFTKDTSGYQELRNFDFLTRGARGKKHALGESTNSRGKKSKH